MWLWTENGREYKCNGGGRKINLELILKLLIIKREQNYHN